MDRPVEAEEEIKETVDETCNQPTKKYRPWVYFLCTYGFTAIFWVSAIFLEADMLEFPTIIFYILGGLSPSLMGIILTYTTLEKDARKDFWKRSIDFKGIKLQWYGLILGINILPTFVAIIVGVILGKQESDFFESVTFFSSFAILTAIAFNLIAVVFEEFGWRGYALDGLNNRFGKLGSSVILGTFWCIWHFPLFFISGSYQNGLGFGSPDFWIFVVNIFTLTIIMTWIYFGTNRSILSVLLFHFLTNFLGEMFELDFMLQLIRAGVFLVIASVISIRWIIRYLKERKKVQTGFKQ